MSWLGLVLVVVGAWLAWKLVGALLKVAMFAVALVGAYWFLAPHLGLPTVGELFYVLGPDFGGRRIEEVLQPSGAARRVTGQVVEGMLEKVVQPLSDAAAGMDAAARADAAGVDPARVDAAAVPQDAGAVPAESGAEPDPLR